MIIEFMSYLMFMAGLTAFPLIAIVGFITEEKFRNPFVALLIISYVLIGVRIWQSRTRKR
jgi:hypothetical protein